VRALPPGHYLVFEGGKIHTRPYFKIAPAEDDPRPMVDITKDYGRRFAEAIRTHSQLATRSAVAYSGGLDSTSVLRVLRKERTDHSNILAATVIVPQDRASEEYDYARRGIDGTDVPWITVEASPIVEWKQLLATADGPDTIPWVPLMANVLVECRERGAQRVLVGCLGDLIGGADLSSIPTLVARRDIKGFVRECVNPRRQGVQFAPRAALRALLTGTSFGRNLATRLATVGAAGKGVGVPPWMSKSAVKLYNLDDRWQRIFTLPQLAVERTSVRFAECLPWAYGELGCVRHCARLTGIETGVPFADRHLVELSASLPLESRRFKGVTRHVHREAMRGMLTEDVRLRVTKAEFSGYHDRIRNCWPAIRSDDLSHLGEWVDARQFATRTGNPGVWKNRLVNLTMISEWLRYHGD
jgi:asparagine synthase (glutamine-hydrolysing)